MRKIKDFVLWAMGIVQIPRNYVFCLLHGLKPDATWRFYGLPLIRIGGRGSSIKIGKKFTVVSKDSHNSFGIIQRANVRTVSHGAQIIIGYNVGISGCTISASKRIEIRDHVMIGSGAIIADSDAHNVDPVKRRNGELSESRPVVIEDNVFIGARAIILKGVTVGHDSTVGAGAVVTKSVPPYSVVAGNPAKIVRTFNVQSI